MSFSRLLALISMGIGSILPHWDRMTVIKAKESSDAKRRRFAQAFGPGSGDVGPIERIGWHPSMAMGYRSGGSLAKHRAKVRGRTGRK